MNEMCKMNSGDNGIRIPYRADDPNNQISQKLREFYDSVQEERVPDRFIDLLEKLDEAERTANAETRPAGTK